MEFIETINQGGFGIVDKMKLNDGTIVARKTFAPSITPSQEVDFQKLYRRFIREVKTQLQFEG